MRTVQVAKLSDNVTARLCTQCRMASGHLDWCDRIEELEAALAQRDEALEKAEQYRVDSLNLAESRLNTLLLQTTAKLAQRDEALKEAVADARRLERETCCRDVCPDCAADVPLSVTGAHAHGEHDWRTCPAAAIRSRSTTPDARESR